MAVTLYILFAVVMLLVIALAETLGEKTGVVAPIILLAASSCVALFSAIPRIEVEPGLILEVILPPLLFATAMRMPAHDIRRNFEPISVLAVVLVVVTAVVVGAGIHAMAPEVPLAYAIAVGAVMSPSDAVATGIVKKAGVSRRVIAILDGEGLINDASALVALRTALLAATVGVSVGGVISDFLWAVVGAVACGFAVGHIMMWLRKHVHHTTSNTVLSLAMPFAAFLPAEELGASGLVATVMAGLVVAHHSVSTLGPSERLNERQTWDTIGLILESAVFLLMGLQLPALIEEARADGYTLGASLAMAAVALVIIMVVRVLIVSPLLWWLRYRGRRNAEYLEILDQFDSQLESMANDPESRQPSKRIEQAKSRTAKRRADVHYLDATQLGWREGTVIVWSGMRGAVTLAAAQTIPEDAPARGYLILLAFIVAAASLVLQGGTLGWLVAKVKPAPDLATSREQRLELGRKLHNAACAIPIPDQLREAMADLTEDQIHAMAMVDIVRATRDSAPKDVFGGGLREEISEYELARLGAKRTLLIAERDAGRVAGPDFDYYLSQLDAQQMIIELQP